MRDNPCHEAVDTVVVEGADGFRFAHAQTVKLRRAKLSRVVVDFVDGQDHWFLGGAQQLSGLYVRGSHAVDHVCHQYDHIGVSHGHLGLFLDQLSDDTFWMGLKSAGVQQDEMVIVPPGIGHQAITGSARYFADDGVPAADNAVEER